MEHGPTGVVMWIFLSFLGTADSEAVAQPAISIVGSKDGGVVLKCESGGCYPEPEMTWLDSNGNVLPDGPTEKETDSEGRYTVRGHVTIQKTDKNTITHRVQQQKINHKMETEIHVPDEVFIDGVFPRPKSDQSVFAGVLILIGAVFGLAAIVQMIVRYLAQHLDFRAVNLRDLHN